MCLLGMYSNVIPNVDIDFFLYFSIYHLNHLTHPQEHILSSQLDNKYNTWNV
jgi:hypothetical protein